MRFECLNHSHKPLVDLTEFTCCNWELGVWIKSLEVFDGNLASRYLRNYVELEYRTFREYSSKSR